MLVAFNRLAGALGLQVGGPYGQWRECRRLMRRRWVHAGCLVEQQITGVVALTHPDSAVLKHENLLANDCNISILPVDSS